MNDLKEDVKAMRLRWKNRRRMAWISLTSMILVTLLLILLPIPTETLVILSNIVPYFYFGCVGVIAAYMGSSVWGQIRIK